MKNLAARMEIIDSVQHHTREHSHKRQGQLVIRERLLILAECHPKRRVYQAVVLAVLSDDFEVIDRLSDQATPAMLSIAIHDTL